MKSLYLIATAMALWANFAGAAEIEHYKSKLPIYHRYNSVMEAQLAANNAAQSLKSVGATVYGTPRVFDDWFVLDFQRPSVGHFSFTSPMMSGRMVSAAGAQEAMQAKISQFLDDCRSEGPKLKCAMVETLIEDIGGGYRYIVIGAMHDTTMIPDKSASAHKAVGRFRNLTEAPNIFE